MKAFNSIFFLVFSFHLALCQQDIINPHSTEKVKALSIKKRTTKDNPVYDACFNPDEESIKIKVSLVYANHPQFINEYTPFNEFFIQSRLDVYYRENLIHISRNYSPIHNLDQYQTVSSHYCNSCAIDLVERSYSQSFDISNALPGQNYTCEDIHSEFSFKLNSTVVLVQRDNPNLILPTYITNNCLDILPMKCFFDGSNYDSGTFKVKCDPCE